VRRWIIGGGAATTASAASTHPIVVDELARDFRATRSARGIRSNIAVITCTPVPTAIASNRSRTSASTSPIATVTDAGALSAVAAVSID